MKTDICKYNKCEDQYFTPFPSTFPNTLLHQSEKIKLAVTLKLVKMVLKIFFQSG